MKRSFILLSTVLLISVYQSTTSSADSLQATTSSAITTNTLKDISTHWAKASIEGAVKNGYVDGYEDGSFKPEKEVTRAEFVKLVASATKSKSIATVEGDNWYKAYIKELQDQGVLGQNFYSDDMMVPIARGEMAVIATKSVDKTSNGNFMDATKLGLIHGLNGGELAPEGKTTRAQAVTVIERILSAKRGEKLPVDKYAMSSAEIEATGSNVGTMLGLKPKEIGTAWTWSKGITVRLNKLIVADPADPDDPYMKLIDMTTWGKSTVKADNKVILANFTVTSTEEGVGAPDLFPSQVLQQLDSSNFLLLSEKGLTRWMTFDKTQTNEGFVAYALPNRIANLGIVFNILNSNTTLATK